MRILQITAFSGWGCTGRIAQGISETLTEQGHESAIAWGRTNTAPQEIRTIQIGNHADQVCHALYTRLTDRCGLGSKTVTRRFLTQLQAYHPDIVHLHIMHGYYVNIEILFRYLKENEIPIVWTFHDCWAITGHCPYFDMVHCDKWKTGCHHCVQKNHHPRSVFLDRSADNYRIKKELFTGIGNMTVVTPSQWLADIAGESFMRRSRIRVIPNGVNTIDFTPSPSDIKKKMGLEDKKILLGVSSTWADGKGLRDFEKLAELLEEPYRIVLVGLDERQMKQLSPLIIGIKRTDSVKELACLYTSADAFLNLTYEDNYPTTNLEAIACGTPVITYRTGGSPEIVEKTHYGAVVEQGNLEQVMEAIPKVGQLTWKPEYTELLEQRNCYRKYVELYREIMEQ